MQLDVLADRLANEYGVPVEFETTRHEVMRWIASDDPKKLDDFIAANRFSIANDLDGSPVLMAQSAFSLNYTLERAPDYQGHRNQGNAPGCLTRDQVKWVPVNRPITRPTSNRRSRLSL